MGVRVSSSANAAPLVNSRMPAAVELRNPRRLQNAHSAARLISVFFMVESFSGRNEIGMLVKLRRAYCEFLHLRHSRKRLSRKVFPCPAANVPAVDYMRAPPLFASIKSRI